MAKVGGLLVVLSMVFLFAVIVMPVLPFLANNTMFDNLLQPLVCAPGEKIQREQYSSSYQPGSTAYSMDISCIDAEGHNRDATDQWKMVGVVGYTLPFVLGLFLLISGVSRSNAKKQAAITAGASFTMPGRSFTIPITIDEEQGSLTGRLREVQNAYEAGLITREEYERLRGEILDSA